MKSPALQRLTSHFGTAFSLSAASLLLLCGAGCSKSASDQASDKMTEAYRESKETMGDAWQNVNVFTFEKRDDFNSEAKARMARFDAQMSEMKKDQADAQASESRKAAWAAVKDSEMDYHHKVDALGSATADTWDGAKADAVAAWDRLNASYQKAKTS